MAYAANTISSLGTVEPRGFFNAIAARLQNWRRYRKTLAELSALSDRELNDIGLSRAAIYDVARDSLR